MQPAVKMRLLRWFCLLLPLCFLTQCSTTRYVPEGSYLLDKVRIINEADSVKLQDNLADYLLQRPNYRLFGLFKWQLRLYSSANPNKHGWWSRQLRKMGEAPVIYEQDLGERSAIQLANALAAEGYLDAKSHFDVDTTRRKKLKLNFHLFPGKLYRIDTIEESFHNPQLEALYRVFKAQQALRVGAALSANAIDAERKELTRYFRNNGYWSFTPEDIYYEVDTLGAQKTNAALKRVVEATDKRPYRINKVHFYTGYESQLAYNTDISTAVPLEEGEYQGYKFFKMSDAKSLRYSTLANATSFAVGDLYSEELSEETYSRLIALPALSNVNIRYKEALSLNSDSIRNLDCYILSAPSKTMSVGAELMGTNSGGDLGTSIALGFTHRNIFGGSELFNIKLKGAYEAIGNQGQSYLGYGAEASLQFPQLLFPLIPHTVRKQLRSSTELKLSYDFQTRPEFNRRLLSAQINYNWVRRSNSRFRHTLRPLDVDYLHLPFIDPAFHQSLPISAALYNYTEQFILGSGYFLQYNSSKLEEKHKNRLSIRMGVQTSGNLLGLISKLSQAEKDEHGAYKMFGLNYSQFVKADFDLAHSLIIDKYNSFAWHIALGAAVPYGNAKEIPFELRYFSGGANSVRGWGVRRLGPGSMPIKPETTFFDQMGDIRFDASIEYRSRLFWKLHLAAYVDAGNVWTIRDYPNQQGGRFRINEFYKEIALSYGLGLRLDFDYFLVRFDTGMKAYDPQEPSSKRWVISRPNFRDKFAWHLAVGYPF